MHIHTTLPPRVSFAIYAIPVPKAFTSRLFIEKLGKLANHAYQLMVKH